MTDVDCLASDAVDTQSARCVNMHWIIEYIPYRTLDQIVCYLLE